MKHNSICVVTLLLITISLLAQGTEKKTTREKVQNNLSIIEYQLGSINSRIGIIQRNIKDRKKKNEISVTEYQKAISLLKDFERKFRLLEAEKYKLDLDFKKLK